jgi:biopolymer transport protein ExbD
MAISAKTSRAVAADINVTPMIDVMLVLLIIFMIVTPAITAGFQATLPRAKNPDSREEAEGEIRLGIDREGKFYLDITARAACTRVRATSRTRICRVSSRTCTRSGRSTRSCI